MAITQVGSAFIGDLTDQITIEKATGAYSRYGNIIHVTDGQTDDIRAIVTSKNVLDNEHLVNIKDHVDTFYAELIGMQDYDEHIVKGNRLIIPAENEGEYNEFVIDEVEDRRSHAKTIELMAYASYLDLRKAKAIKPFRRTGTAREHMFFALSDTEFEVGLVESDREITISFENWTNPYEYLLRIAREFELELDFKVMHNGYTVTNRVVEAVRSLGRYRGREVTFGKDLQEINRKEVGDIYTALIGLGPERDDGSRLEVFVEDIDALKRWGRPKHAPKHLIGVYEPQSEREDMTLKELRQYTQTELNKRKNSVIQYEVSFLDLEHLLGDEAKKIRKGDTILIKDTYFTPHLYVEARVIEVRRNAVVPVQKEYILGDFIEHDAETVHDLYKYVKRELVKKASVERLLNYAEPKKIESDTPPEIKDGENPIWIDTSKTPHVAYVANAGKWVKMTPTEPKEVGAYSRREVDDKTAQALKDAKVYAENAENIKKGIIDVGAVPLRTSETGARIEWDGVNGLVQYDQQGRTTSQIDIGGNARFANAFVTGRVEATEGYFGKNKRVTIGDDGLTIERPDGVTWMQDGLVRQGYSIIGFDPHFTDTKIYDASGQRSSVFADEGGSIAFDGWYEAPFGWTDGRDVYGMVFRDIRDQDLGYTIRFQRYEFLHSSRFIRFDYRIANNPRVGKHRVRIVEVGSPPTGYDAIYLNEDFEEGDTGLKRLEIDMGPPSYQVRTVDFRIGHLKQWGASNKVYRFRINRIVQYDSE